MGLTIMHLAKFIVFRKITKETTAEAFQRVTGALADHGWAGRPIRLFFRDASSKGVSACRRIVKNFPLLADLRMTGVLGRETTDCLSNLGNDWDERYSNGAGINELVPLDVLFQIAEGIPKRYPLLSADFIFDDIPFSEWTVPSAAIGQTRDFSTPHGLRKPCVHLDSSWGMTRRDVVLSAYVPLELTPEGPRPWSPATAGFVAKLGRPDMVFPVFTPHSQDIPRVEAAKDRAKKLVSSFEQDLPNRMSEIGLPNSFPESNPGEPLGAVKEEIPRRKLITSAVGPMGYAYLSGSGTHSYMNFVKMTSNNNRIDLLFDFGTGYYRLECTVRFQTPHGWNQFDVWFDPARQYPLAQTAHSFEKALENLRIVIKFCEVGILKELDSLYGMSPSWFEYERW